MRKDERLQTETKKIESMSYQILKWGLLGIIIFRFIVLKQSVQTILDIFILWLVVVTIEFFYMSIKGVPINFPVQMSKKEKHVFIIVLPIISGAVSVLILALTQQLKSFGHGLFTFGLTAGILLILLIGYQFLYIFWEKKTFDKD